MFKSISVLFRFFFFWLIFFFLERLVFILYYANRLKDLSLFEISKTFIYGLWIDMSMAGYISALPLLVFIICWLTPGLKISEKIPNRYNQVLIVIFSFLCVINFNIYREWGTKINYTAFYNAFTAPNEVLASSASSPVFSSLIIFVILAGTGLFLSKRLIDYKLPARIHIFKAMPISIVFLILNFLAIRGGWQLAPMNESMAYFSENTVLNHAAVNTEWGLLKDVLNNKYGKKNPYLYFKPGEPESIIAEINLKTSKPADLILTTARPNIVFIIMESFTAELVEALGGEKGVTPNMDGLIANGLFFTNIYASGDRTDKGLTAVLSAFPAQAVRSIIKENTKQEKLPSIAQTLSKSGYNTSIYYGGEIEFDNFKSYFLSHSFQRLVYKSSFLDKDMNSKWGAYDGTVYNKQLADLRTEKQPFFSTLLTLTNHEPFELPVKPHFAGNDVEDKFRSTAYYADSCLADYLKKAAKEPWYKNTLFVIVADHGHRLPANKYEIYHPNRFRIPLLFYGDALKPEYKGKRINRIASQVDIAHTVLNQMGLDATQFKWSKDMLNPATKQFSFYSWDNGFGYVTPEQSISFDNVSRRVIYRKNHVGKWIDDKSLRYGKANMQEVYQEYLDY